MALDKAAAKEIEKLVKDAQQGNVEAFGKIYDYLVLPIYRYVYYRVNRGEVEDLTEMVFLKAWENIKRYKKQRKNTFATWLYRIAHNVVVDQYRSNSKGEVLELDENLTCERKESDPVSVAQLKFDQQELGLAIRKLPQVQQQVVVLKFINDLENDEIAKIVDKSEGAVRVIQHRALERLKKILNRNSKKKCNKSESLAFETVDNG